LARPSHRSCGACRQAEHGVVGALAADPVGDAHRLGETSTRATSCTMQIDVAHATVDLGDQVALHPIPAPDE
jgi:hypothetical protein